MGNTSANMSDDGGLILDLSEDAIVSIIASTPAIYRDVIFLSKGISRAAVIAVPTAEMFYAPTWAYFVKTRPQTLELFASVVGQYNKMLYVQSPLPHSKVITITTRYEANIVRGTAGYESFVYRTPHRWIFDEYDFPWSDDCKMMMDCGCDSSSTTLSAKVMMWFKYMIGTEPTNEEMHAHGCIDDLVNVKDIDTRATSTKISASLFKSSATLAFSGIRAQLLQLIPMMASNLNCDFTEENSHTCDDVGIESILGIFSDTQLIDIFADHSPLFSVKFLVKVQQIQRDRPDVVDTYLASRKAIVDNFRDVMHGRTVSKGDPIEVGWSRVNWFIRAISEPWMIDRTPSLPWDIEGDIAQLLNGIKDSQSAWCTPVIRYSADYDPNWASRENLVCSDDDDDNTGDNNDTIPKNRYPSPHRDYLKKFNFEDNPHIENNPDEPPDVTYTLTRKVVEMPVSLVEHDRCAITFSCPTIDDEISMHHTPVHPHFDAISDFLNKRITTSEFIDYLLASPTEQTEQTVQTQHIPHEIIVNAARAFTDVLKASTETVEPDPDDHDTYW